MLNDLRHACRHVARRPGVTIGATLLVAASLGASIAALSLLDALEYRPLPISRVADVVGLSVQSRTGQARLLPLSVVSEISTLGLPLDHPCAYTAGGIVAVEVGGRTLQAVVGMLAGECFELFGVEPALGRTFRHSEAPLRGRRAAVGVIGHRFWQRAFGGEQNLVGRSIRLESGTVEAIGVMPAGFGGLQVDTGVDLWVPFNTVIQPPPGREPAGSHLLARLRSRQQLATVSTQVEALWPTVRAGLAMAALSATERASLEDSTARIESLSTGLSSLRVRFAPAASILTALTVTLAALAALSVGALLLTRAAQRGPEMAIRIALGGSRSRVAALVGLESALTVMPGIVLAVPVATALTRPVKSYLPMSMVEPAIALTPDWRVLSVGAALAGLLAVLASILPILFAFTGVQAHSRAQSRSVIGGASPWTRWVFTLQVALSFAAISCAASLGLSLNRLQKARTGVETSHVLVFRLMPVVGGYTSVDRPSYYQSLLDNVEAVPGVVSAGTARFFPRLVTDVPGERVTIVGGDGTEGRAFTEYVSPGFRESVALPLIRGQFFTPADGPAGQSVGVVNEAAARLLSRNGPIVGRLLRSGGGQTAEVEVVGIVGSATLGNPRFSELPVLYRPFSQAGPMAGYPNLMVTVEGPRDDVIRSVSSAVTSLGREHIQSVEDLGDILRGAPAAERLSATVGVVVALLALALCWTAVFVLLSQAALRRTTEFGLRMALGARPAAIVRLVAADGNRLAFAGLASGAPLAWLGGRVMRPMLFGVGGLDYGAAALAAGGIVLAAVAAALLPSLRAARTDPASALRGD